MRVYELAKELGLSSKEVIQRLNKMGVDVTTHSNSISDMDATALRNAVQRSKEKTETKIVRVVRKNPAKAPADNAAKAPAAKPAEKAAAPAAKPAAPVKEPAPAAKPAAPVKEQAPAAKPAAPEKKAAPEAGQAKKAPQQKAPEAARTEKPAAPEKQAAPAAKPAAKPAEKPAAKAPQQKPPAEKAAGKKEAAPQAGKKEKHAEGANKKTAPAGRTDNVQPRKDNRNRPEGKQGKKAGKNNRQNDRRDDHSKKTASRDDRRKNDNRKDNKPALRDISKPTKHSHGKDHRKEQRKEAARQAEQEAMAIPAGAVVVTVPITVKGFAEQIDVSVSQIIMKLMKMGIMANVNENLDEDTVMILGDELNKQIIIGNVEEDTAEEGIEDFEDREEDLRPRPPVITVMGHVDHGKTSLLDKIRKTDVTASESGGITQHIGASEIHYEGQRIVFLDTPGHEAFTAMRARGAYVTDIAVLVVAADDSVKPQTIEAISHAKAAGVPVIVAINKIDKPGANVERVKQDLSANGILVEDWGGTVISVPVSAKTGEGLDALLEMILLQAEMLELKANPNRLAMGSVIEARLDKQRGPIATLLIQNGTLRTGMSIVAGNCYGRIKAMTNYKGTALKKAGPATAVEILGLDEVPEAGDSFNAVNSDKVAREIAENRREKQREQVLQKTSGVSLEDLFNQISQGSLKELNLIIKADVQGSVGALVSSLEKLKNDEVAVCIIHIGVGAVNESDVMLAGTSGAVIIGFNVRPGAAVVSMAQRENVEIRTYSVIYEVIEDVEAALKGMLSPEFKEEVLGSAEVRSTFKVPNVGTVAGAYVIDGKIERNAQIRLVRDGIVIHEGVISSLKRFKDDAKEVAKGYECGIGIENYNDIKEGDVMEAFKIVEVERK
ncbi:MAG: translation initiation factor IF-2 [Firmicutes bacterium]|nr:translation initiation factor IF-2 [Bacillota bacterium]